MMAMCQILLLLLFMDSTLSQYPDINYVMSSSWSMWSPWSFCSNNLMIRVRACSTVRGFKCVGRNKEFQSCDSGVIQRSREQQGDKDIDHPDPYSEDRQLAMKQLYQDYDPGVPIYHRNNPRVKMTRPPITTPPRENVFIEQFASRFPVDGPTSAPEPTTISTLRPSRITRLPNPTFKYTRPITTEQATTPTTTTESTTTFTQSTTTQEEKEIGRENQISEEEEESLFAEPDLEELEERRQRNHQPSHAFAAPTNKKEIEQVEEIISTQDGILQKLSETSTIRSEFSYDSEEEPTLTTTKSFPILPSENVEISKNGMSYKKPESIEEQTKTTESIFEENSEETTTNQESLFTENSEEITTTQESVFTEKSEEMTTIKITDFEENSGEITTKESIFAVNSEENTTIEASHPQIVHPIRKEDKEIIDINGKKARMNRLKRLRKINQRARVRTMAVLATDRAFEKEKETKEEKKEEDEEEEQPPTPIIRELPKEDNEKVEEIIDEINRKKQAKKTHSGEVANSLDVSSRMTPSDLIVLEETKKLQRRVQELQERVAAAQNMQKEQQQTQQQHQQQQQQQQQDSASKVEEQKKTVETSVKKGEEVHEEALHGDTARALTWLIANMTRMMEDGPELPILDMVPLQKVEDIPAFRIQDSETDKRKKSEDLSELVQQENNFIRRKAIRRSPSVTWSEWSDWSECNCGEESRKRVCIPRKRRPKINMTESFVPIPLDDFKHRIRRSTRLSRCPPPQYETRRCISSICRH